MKKHVVTSVLNDRVNGHTSLHPSEQRPIGHTIPSTPGYGHSRKEIETVPYKFYMDAPSPFAERHLLGGENKSVTQGARDRHTGHSASHECCWMHPRRCGIFFEDGEALLEHIKAFHLSSTTVCWWESCKRGQAQQTTGKNLFKKKDNVLSHIRIHLNYFPHSCEICKKTFKRHSDYKKHIKQIHIHSQHSTTSQPPTPPMPDLLMRQPSLSDKTSYTFSHRYDLPSFPVHTHDHPPATQSRRLKQPEHSYVDNYERRAHSNSEFESYYNSSNHDRNNHSRQDHSRQPSPSHYDHHHYSRKYASPNDYQPQHLIYSKSGVNGHTVVDHDNYRRQSPSYHTSDDLIDHEQPFPSSAEYHQNLTYAEQKRSNDAHRHTRQRQHPYRYRN